jgi:acyl carrier protein
MTDSWRPEALRRLEVIFRDQFLDDSIRLAEHSSPEQIEAWDSLAHVNLLAAVEAEFRIKFTTDEFGEISNVAGILDALQVKMSQG